MTGMAIVFWYWWAIALVLLVVELLIPGFFFLWMSASAFITGCLLLLTPSLNVDVQLFIFSLLSVISIAVWRYYFKRHQPASDHPLLNKRSAQYVGRVFTLDEPIVNGQGKIKVDDSIWKVEGEDCDCSVKVKVTGVNGAILLVKRAH
jgi:membrane protein implicated in regulation of membrane protease activity